MRYPFCQPLLMALLFNGATGNVWAQQKLEGYLTDKVTTQPVAFAHVQIKGISNAGTVSNEEGFFKLEFNGISDVDTILISHINYLPSAITMRAFREQKTHEIQLSENVIKLEEVQIHSIEDYQAFEDVLNQTKQSLHFPMTSNLYYREFVKENKSFNKFADGLLTVVYGKVDDDNKIKISVDQCRTQRLPKDEEDQFELASPVKVEAVLGYEFANFLNRFRKENQSNYHFYSLNDNATMGDHLILIEPKKTADRSGDKILYRATIKADQYNTISEVQLVMDSLCQFEKSLFGMNYSITGSEILLTFKRTNGIYHLAFARVNFSMKFTTKKFQQTENFISEFVTIAVAQEEKQIPKANVFKKTSLYKHPNEFKSEFWRGLNIPVLTTEEEKLMLELESKAKVNNNVSK